jgi:hypothetical protein
MTYVGRFARALSQSKMFRSVALRARDRKQARAVRRLRSLNSYEERVFSQNGEDGIIKELFSRIPHNRYFVEIGVEDGTQCNAAFLARVYGWRGLMVEADRDMFLRLKGTFGGLAVQCVNEYVDRDNIAPLFERYDVPRKLDLLSIDIDGNDYYVWEATANFKPSVAVIEYNASLGPDASKTIQYNPSHVWRHDRYYGASLAALAHLGKRLGYALIGTDRRGVNSFFVRRDLLGACGFAEKTAAEAWRPNRLIQLLPAGPNDFTIIR